MSFNDGAIVSVKGNDYRVYFWYMNKFIKTRLFKGKRWNIKYTLFYHKQQIQMNKEITTCGVNKIEKRKCHRYENSIFFKEYGYW